VARKLKYFRSVSNDAICQAHALQQVLKTKVAAQRIESGINLDRIAILGSQIRLKALDVEVALSRSEWLIRW
jgi:hypothetical protein